MNISEGGERDEGKQTITCAVQVQVQTQINNKSTVCEHPGSKCDNVSSKCLKNCNWSQIN